MRAVNKHNFGCKLVKIFLPVSFNICFGCLNNIYVLGAQKKRLNETVLLSTHNICFSQGNRK